MPGLQKHFALTEPAELLGDWHPLVEQLGSTEGLATLTGLAATLHLPRVDSPRDLRRFLKSYQTRILLPLELPAIRHAYSHAARGELRELVRLDQQLAGEPELQDFALASQRIGRAQLKRLRPLRDQRIVQRYLSTIEAGDAHGWHTLVYGLTLALYSLPLRQGLLHYSQQTLRGFVHAAARSLELSEREGWDMLGQLDASLPRTLDRLLAQPGPMSFQAC